MRSARPARAPASAPRAVGATAHTGCILERPTFGLDPLTQGLEPPEQSHAAAHFEQERIRGLEAHPRGEAEREHRRPLEPSSLAGCISHPRFELDGERERCREREAGPDTQARGSLVRQ